MSDSDYIGLCLVSHRPGAKGAICPTCGNPILMRPEGWNRTVIKVHEHKEGWFRGDDTVTFYHEHCEITPNKQ